MCFTLLSIPMPTTFALVVTYYGAAVWIHIARPKMIERFSFWFPKKCRLQTFVPVVFYTHTPFPTPFEDGINTVFIGGRGICMKQNLKTIL